MYRREAVIADSFLVVTNGFQIGIICYPKKVCLTAYLDIFELTSALDAVMKNCQQGGQPNCKLFFKKNQNNYASNVYAVIYHLNTSDVL